jgi:hypothetical protein
VQLAGNEGGGPGSARLASAAGRWVLAVAVLGEAMVLPEATVVNVALPSIGRDLRAGAAGLQWTLDGYVLTLAALVLAAGSLSDIYGWRRVFTLGDGGLRGRVRAVRGGPADASIMPDVPSVAINPTVILMAEIVADRVKAARAKTNGHTSVRS